MSFTDAAIVTVARRRGARFVATFDRDFRKVEGLAVVPA
jgi:predicted nucleic acid-binding protein